MTRRYVIVGGGLVGLFTAFVLLEQGHGVTIHSTTPPGTAGNGVASWAGGGILSPLRPWTAPDAVTRLVFPSVGGLPALLARLEKESGLPGGWRGGGMRVFPADAPVSTPGGNGTGTLETLGPLAWGRRLGIDIKSCHDRQRGDGLWLPGIGSVHNPHLCRLMAAAVVARGGRFSPQAVPAVGRPGIREIEAWASQFTSTGGSVDAVIVCAGAWTGRLLGFPEAVYPVRGQMARVVLDRPLAEIVQIGARYLVPRGENTAVVGSTLEPDAGYAAIPTPGGRAVLEAWLAEQADWLGPARITHHWAGLRPGSRDGIPLIGALNRHGTVWVAAGHYRNGICSALGTATFLADLLAGRPPAFDPVPYDPQARLGTGSIEPPTPATTSR